MFRGYADCHKTSCLVRYFIIFDAKVNKRFALDNALHKYSVAELILMSDQQENPNTEAHSETGQTSRLEVLTWTLNGFEHASEIHIYNNTLSFTFSFCYQFRFLQQNHSNFSCNMMCNESPCLWQTNPKLSLKKHGIIVIIFLWGTLWHYTKNEVFH